MTTLALAIAPARERGSARLAYGLACALGGSLLVAGLAHLSIRLPFTPVPITGQTLGVLLVGAALGPALGGASIGLYLLEGALGLPFYAQDKGGWEWLGLASATGGYLWGFLAAGMLVGWLARHGWDRNVRSALGAMLLGEVVVYAVGVPWLSAAVEVPGAKALELGLYPFVLGDTIKLLLAACLLPATWRLVGRARGDVR